MYYSSSNESNTENYSSEENDYDKQTTRRKLDSESEEDPRPQVLLDLWTILSKLKAPSTFASSGEVVSIPPGLQIKSYGDLGLPLRERDAKEIFAQYQKTPVRRGPKNKNSATLQIDASEVELLNDKFVEQIKSATSAVAVELGLDPATKVEAQLSKLLLFETGGTFSLPKDKTKGAFASLIVTLPSTFEGGELTVSHQGIDMQFVPQNTTFTTSYAAFYSSCKYTLQPVTSGFRLALLYNIVVLEGPVPRVPNNSAVINAKKCLRRWETQTGSGVPTKAVIVMKHKYAADKISVHNLIKEDRAIAQVLQEAVKGEEFELFIGLLHYRESGDYEMEKIDDKTFKIEALYDVRGEPSNAQINWVYSTGVYPPDAFEDENYDYVEKDKDDWWRTGHYKRAALVVWPKNKWIDLLCEGHSNIVIKNLEELIAKCSDEPRDSPAWKAVERMASKLMTKIIIRLTASHSFLNSLGTIGDFQMIQKYLTELGKLHLTEVETEKFCIALDRCLEQFGWEALGDPIEKLLTKCGVESAVAFLQHYTAKKISNKKAQQAIFAIANKLIKETYPSDYFSSKETLSKVVNIACAIDQRLVTDIFNFIAKRYANVDTELIPTLTKLRELDASIEKNPEYINLVNHCINFIKDRIAAAKARSEDWSIIFAQLNCKCQHCVPIAQFLKSPTETIYKFTISPSHIRDALRPHYKQQYNFAGLVEVREDRNGKRIEKIGKEADVVKKDVVKDEAKVAELKSLIASNYATNGRETKRRKITHQK